MDHFGTIAFGTQSREHQGRRGSLDGYLDLTAGPAPTGLGPHEIEFLRERDSFYLASVGEAGWPYVQHRGGPAGFIKVVDETRIAWADRPGNRQFVSAGNLDADGRVAIIAVDYPNKRRIKLLGRASFDPQPDATTLASLGIDGRIEGLVTVEVVAFDWNCPKHLTPRFTIEEVRAGVEPLTKRIEDLESELTRLRALVG